MPLPSGLTNIVGLGPNSKSWDIGDIALGSQVRTLPQCISLSQWQDRSYRRLGDGWVVPGGLLEVYSLGSKWLLAFTKVAVRVKWKFWNVTVP